MKELLDWLTAKTRPPSGGRGSVALHYGCAVAAIGLALAVRLLLAPLLGEKFPFSTFYFAILLTALFGGCRPALLAVILGGLASDYFLLPTRGSFLLATMDERIGMLLYFFTGGGIAVLGGVMEAARWRLQVAERRHAAQAAAQLAAIVESSDDVIVGKDLRGIITSWNGGAERVFGYTAAETVGHSITMLIPPDRQAEETEILSRITRGESVRHFETVRLRKDGAPIDVSVTVSAIRDASGGIIGASKVARDITTRKHIEQALREGEERFRTMANSIPQLAWNAYADGSVFWYNERWYEYTGTTAAEMDGEGWQTVYDPEALPGLMERWKTAIEIGDPFEMEFLLRGADGSFRTFLTRIQPLKDSSGRVMQWFGTNTDITEIEQRVIERTVQLDAANKEIEAFSYSISHDLRAPLRAVDGFSQAVIEDYGQLLPDEGRRYLGTIRHGAQQMAALIDDLLAFSRLSRAPLNKRTVDTCAQVRSVIATFHSQFEGRSIDVRIGDLPPCQADAALLKQVWINLLSNAIKYTQKREAAVVEIGCERSAEGDVFFVRDNGTGFDMRYAHKLFGVFQRLHRAEDYEGTGVGLAIVQRIISRHGGRIWAEAAVDRGATFHFTLEGEKKI